MKNSFFLVIPAQQKDPGLLSSYEKVAVNQWVSELPTANPSLSTRLFFDFIENVISIEMPAQQRLDCLEALRPHFLTIEDYLRSRLIRSGFPKGEDEQKILDLVVSIEKNFTIGYWIVLKELTRRDIGWFQGKNVALALQRTIKGLSEIVVTHYMMFLPVSDWIWIDLHSLYKLSVKIKKEGTKVTDETILPNKTSTAEDCYKQVLLLSLTDPSGLMQKEVKQVYEFIAQITQYVRIEKKTVSDQDKQCIVLMDEDIEPSFTEQQNQLDSSLMYLNLLKMHKALAQPGKFSSKDEARFSSMHVLRNASEKLPYALFDYIIQSWKGAELKGGTFFADRLDRYIAVGLNATHSLQGSLDASGENVEEILAESFSDRGLACKFEKEGVLSIGSLVSFRQKKDPETKRVLGVVKKITMPKQAGNIIFELSHITPQSYAVTYTDIDEGDTEKEEHKGLLYGEKNEMGEQSFLIVESFMHKDGDVLRMFMNDNNFPIILGGRKNIGLGYWQFECRQIEEKKIAQKVTKKGYDFI